MDAKIKKGLAALLALFMFLTSALPVEAETFGFSNSASGEKASEAEVSGEAAGSNHADSADADGICEQSIPVVVGRGAAVKLAGPMPEDADVEVRETESDLEGALCAYDITINEGWQPKAGDPVEVTIHNRALAGVKAPVVYHVLGDGSFETAEVESFGDGYVVFKAEGFSVYVVGESTATRTYKLMVENEGSYSIYPYALAGSEEGNGVFKLKEGESFNLPQLADREDECFLGWYTSNGELTESDAPLVRVTAEGVSGDDPEVMLYARFGRAVYATFYAYVESSSDEMILSRVRKALIGGKASIDLSEIPQPVPSEEHTTFSKWQESVSRNTYDSDAELEISRDTVFYPKFETVSTISFQSAAIGEGATYIAHKNVPKTAGENIVSGKLSEVPSRMGYTFNGWYTEADKGGIRITDENANILSGEDGFNGGTLSDGKLTVLDDFTLYGGWDTAPSSFRVVVWKEKVEDTAKLADTGDGSWAVPEEEKTYDYAFSLTLDQHADSSAVYSGDSIPEDDVASYKAITGDYTPAGSSQAVSFTGFKFEKMDSLTDLTVAANGSTEVNIYYDRIVMTYTFTYPASSFADGDWEDTHGELGDAEKYYIDNGTRRKEVSGTSTKKIYSYEYEDFTLRGLYGSTFEANKSVNGGKTWTSSIETKKKSCSNTSNWYVKKTSHFFSESTYDWTQDGNYTRDEDHTTTAAGDPESIQWSSNGTRCNLLTNFNLDPGFTAQETTFTASLVEGDDRHYYFYVGETTNIADDGSKDDYSGSSSDSFSITDKYDGYSVDKLVVSNGSATETYENIIENGVTAGNLVVVSDGKIVVKEGAKVVKIYNVPQKKTLTVRSSDRTHQGSPKEYIVPYNSLIKEALPESPSSEEFTFPGAGADAAGYELCGYFADAGLTKYVDFSGTKTLEEVQKLSKEITEVIDYSAARMPNTEMVLYAGWLKKRFVVQIDPDHGEFADTSSSTYFKVDYGEYVVPYEVRRNYDVSSGGSYYYHIYTYADSVSGKADDPENPRKARYQTSEDDWTDGKTYKPSDLFSFLGWYKGDSLYNFSAPVTEDLTIKAHWLKRGKYFISYEGGEHGTASAFDPNAYQDDGQVVILNGAQAASGYEFVGWSLKDPVSGSLGDEILRPGEIWTVDSDYSGELNEEDKGTITLAARYEQANSTYVEFDKNAAGAVYSGSAADYSGSGSYGLTDNGYRISALALNQEIELDSGSKFARSGYQLAGWAKEPAAENPDFTLADIQSGNVRYALDNEGANVLYAVWKPFYTVTFNANGGTWLSAPTGFEIDDDDNYYVKVLKGATVTAPDAAPDKTGVGFAGWAASASAEEALDLSAYPINANTQFYAVWSYDRNIDGFLLFVGSELIKESDGVTYTRVDDVPSGLVHEKKEDINELIQAGNYVNGAAFNHIEVWSYADTSDDRANPGNKSKVYEIGRIYDSTGVHTFYTLAADPKTAILLDAAHELVLVCDKKYTVTYNVTDNGNPVSDWTEYINGPETLDLGEDLELTYKVPAGTYKRITAAYSVNGGEEKNLSTALFASKVLYRDEDDNVQIDGNVVVNVTYTDAESFGINGNITNGGLCDDVATNVEAKFTHKDSAGTKSAGNNAVFYIYGNYNGNSGSDQAYVLKGLDLNGQRIELPVGTTSGISKTETLDDPNGNYSDITIELLGIKQLMGWYAFDESNNGSSWLIPNIDNTINKNNITLNGTPISDAGDHMYDNSIYNTVYKVTITNLHEDIVATGEFQQHNVPELALEDLTGISQTAASETNDEKYAGGTNQCYPKTVIKKDNNIYKAAHGSATMYSVVLIKVKPGYNPYSAVYGTEEDSSLRILYNETPYDTVKNGILPGSTIKELADGYSSAHTNNKYAGLEAAEYSDSAYNWYGWILETSGNQDVNQQEMIIHLSPYTYQVRYDLAGGSVAADDRDTSNYVYGDGYFTDRAQYSVLADAGSTKVTVSAAIPTREGYKFTGWKLTGSETTYSAGDVISVNSLTVGHATPTSGTADAYGQSSEGMQYVLTAQWESTSESGGSGSGTADYETVYDYSEYQQVETIPEGCTLEKSGSDQGSAGASSAYNYKDYSSSDGTVYRQINEGPIYKRLYDMEKTGTVGSSVITREEAIPAGFQLKDSWSVSRIDSLKKESDLDEGETQRIVLYFDKVYAASVYWAVLDSSGNLAKLGNRYVSGNSATFSQAITSLDIPTEEKQFGSADGSDYEAPARLLLNGVTEYDLVKVAVRDNDDGLAENDSLLTECASGAATLQATWSGLRYYDGLKNDDTAAGSASRADGTLGIYFIYKEHALPAPTSAAQRSVPWLVMAAFAGGLLLLVRKKRLL
ncbi:MAG: InlB B-repeat-containing protein [Lachnospiraceae bacterium]|nr:InlB B-repeat-containing protein [Lachnospiraceae bacterium]